MDLSGIPTPVMNWEASNLPEAWKKFQQHVELVFNGPLEKKSEKAKCTYLLLWIGEKGRDIFNTWSDVSEEERHKLATYYVRFKAHIQPKLNSIFARYKFNMEIQKESTIEEFVTRLKLLAIDCSFGNDDAMIRDRIVFGTSSSQVREKLINQGDKLTLDKAIQICQTYAYTKEQLNTMTLCKQTASQAVCTATPSECRKSTPRAMEKPYTKFNAYKSTSP